MYINFFVCNNYQENVFTYIVCLHYIVFFLKDTGMVSMIYQVTVAAFFLVVDMNTDIFKLN